MSVRGAHIDDVWQQARVALLSDAGDGRDGVVGHHGYIS